MLGPSYKLARVWGIPIKVNITLIALLLLIGIAAEMTEGVAGLVRNLLLIVAVFASIALHELAHSFVALRKGCRVREITLLFFGGAAQMERIPTRPRDEFQMAGAGPAFSLLLGALCWSLGAFMPLHPAFYGSWVGHELNILQFVGMMNFGLAGFNLLPAFPLDGGRIFRALMTRRIGRLPATFVASRVGRLFALGMGMYGLTHYDADGWWILVPIAVFVYIAAGKEYAMAVEQESHAWPDALYTLGTESAPCGIDASPPSRTPPTFTEPSDPAPGPG